MYTHKKEFLVAYKTIKSSISIIHWFTSSIYALYSQKHNIRIFTLFFRKIWAVKWLFDFRWDKWLPSCISMSHIHTSPFSEMLGNHGNIHNIYEINILHIYLFMYINITLAYFIVNRAKSLFLEKPLLLSCYIFTALSNERKYAHRELCRKPIRFINCIKMYIYRYIVIFI